MKALLAILVALLLPTLAFGQAFDFPNSPTLNQQVTAPNGAIYKWDGTKWIAAGGSASFAPLLNPAGGINNYAPIASPSFTGAVGIGVAAPTTAGQLLQITSNGNFLTQASISNSTSGTSAGSIIRFSNDTLNTGAAWIVLTSTAYTGSGPNLPGDTLQIGANGVGGINLSTNATITPGPPITIWSGPNQAGQFTQNGLVLPLTTSTTASSLMFGPTTSNTSLSAFTMGGGNAVWSIGGYSNNNTWIATNTAAIMQNLTQAAFSNLGGIAWYINDGLTVGSTYTPTVVMQLGPVGNTNTTLNINNPNAGNNTSANMYANNGTYTAQMTMFGTGYSSNPAFAANETVFGGNGSNVDIVAFNNAPTIGVKFYAGGGYLGKFRADGNGFMGLELPGYASRIGTGGNGNSSLAFGNMYLSGTAFATGGMSGSVYNNGTNWISDGGTGGGGALIFLSGTCITMYNTGAVTGGTIVSWTSIGSWCGSGMSTDHLSNLTSFRLPTVSSGALTQDSRDMFGWVTNVTGGQTTITFAEPFITQSNCSLTASGAPYLWFNANQSASQDTFVCAVPWTGAPCPDGTTVEYQCFGQAGEPVKTP